MAAASLLGYLRLAYLSKPQCERALYRVIRKTKPQRIVEIGIQTATRSQRMISVAQRYQPEGVSFCGIDLFEAREDSASGIALKNAHKLLRSTGASVKLVPGDPFSALARSSNGLTQTDLLLISADQDEASLERAWFYLPRMLHENSVVFQENLSSEKSGNTWQRVNTAAILDQAKQTQGVRRAA